MQGFSRWHGGLTSARHQRQADQCNPQANGRKEQPYAGERGRGEAAQDKGGSRQGQHDTCIAVPLGKVTGSYDGDRPEEHGHGKKGRVHIVEGRVEGVVIREQLIGRRVL